MRLYKKNVIVYYGIICGNYLHTPTLLRTLEIHPRKVIIITYVRNTPTKSNYYSYCHQADACFN